MKAKTPAQRGAATRKRNREQDALIEAYCSEFGPWSGTLYVKVLRAMKRALKTGVDDPILIEQREKIERNTAAYDAALAAEHPRRSRLNLKSITRPDSKTAS